jgi:hypothetical protein
MSNYISLIVPQKLSKSVVLQWFTCVETQLPSGLIGKTTLYSHDITRESNFYAKKTRSGKFCYTIPLVRDITDSELYFLVQEWNKTFPKGDFLIDSSQNTVTASPGATRIQDTAIDEILNLWAKHQHTRWMKEAVDKGWKFGIKMSTAQKTHPLIQPWEQLPSTAREQNIEAVKDLLSILDNFGYQISQKTTA